MFRKSVHIFGKNRPFRHQIYKMNRNGLRLPRFSNFLGAFSDDAHGLNKATRRCFHGDGTSLKLQ